MKKPKKDSKNTVDKVVEAFASILQDFSPLDFLSEKEDTHCPKDCPCSKDAKRD